MTEPTVAQYGVAQAYREPRSYRRWKTRADGIRQRYRFWKEHTKKPTLSKPYPARIEFKGTKKELYKAMVIAQEYVPSSERRFITVDARKFYENPEEYCVKGIWAKRQVEYEEETVPRRRR